MSKLILVVEPTEEKRQRYYQIIADESARLTRMVEELFDVARLEAGQAELRLEEMQVGPWLTEFAESFRPADGVRLELAVTADAAASRIYGDRDRLRQVLTNLVANAVRFTPPGEAVRLEAAVAGLGLAIVKALVEAHGGTLGVTSRPGEGAAFWFRLKRAT